MDTKIENLIAFAVVTIDIIKQFVINAYHLLLAGCVRLHLEFICLEVMTEMIDLALQSMGGPEIVSKSFIGSKFLFNRLLLEMDI